MKQFRFETCTSTAERTTELDMEVPSNPYMSLLKQAPYDRSHRKVPWQAAPLEVTVTSTPRCHHLRYFH